VGALALAVPLILQVSSGRTQWYRPQSDRDLKLHWNAERLGPSRVLIVGEIRNLSAQPAGRVILLAEGLDQAGKVVSRARGYVAGELPPRGASNFEIRLVPSGSEQQYRVTVDYFEFVDPFERERRSP
jgi:hypothetical protein